MFHYKTSTLSTRNGAVDSQVKSNARNNLIYGQHRCGKICVYCWKSQRVNRPGFTTTP
ncbi:50S ribosomal protein L2, chloroplastic [Apostasia shenzhenica]|uniref:50S ribosomal protein L2, chloroplastic n=1 Tax=Apostasia shenzhenica TaxID=1088818 RepID=A0A2I0AM22_9ASPA|nr:50S ribosomal protein L2, chloroplastic [Apostasia shenzhenica]